MVVISGWIWGLEEGRGKTRKIDERERGVSFRKEGDGPFKGYYKTHRRASRTRLGDEDRRENRYEAVGWTRTKE